MVTLFHDATPLEDENDIAVGNGGQSMSDEDGSAVSSAGIRRCLRVLVAEPLDGRSKYRPNVFHDRSLCL